MTALRQILSFVLLALFSARMVGCAQIKSKPKEQALNQAVIVGGSCVDQKKSIPEGSRGLIRVDIIKNLRSGASQIVGQGFVSKSPLTKVNPYDLLGADPRGKTAQRGLELTNLGLTLDLYFEEQPSDAEPGVPAVVSRERIERAVSQADPDEVARIRERMVTLHGNSQDRPGFFRAQSRSFSQLDVRARSETRDGRRGMGSFASFVLMTKAGDVPSVELLIPSDPQPDDLDYEDPTMMPKGKIGGALTVAFEADPNRPEEQYGSRFRDSSLVVEFQGKDRTGDWVRRCVAPDKGEATMLEIPLDAAAMTGRAGPVSLVLARKYRTSAPVGGEGGGDLYFEVNSVVITGGILAPGDTK